MAKEPIHYKYIDALRGFAFLGVLSFHIGATCAPLEAGCGFALLGRYGVQLFFMLSAVTLLGSIAQRSAVERFPVRNFFIRRLFRIGPLFWFGIALYFLLMGSGPRAMLPNGLRPWHYIVTALFLHGWTPTSIGSVVPGGWSIAVEMCFYVCLPFLAAWITSARAALISSVCSLAAAIPLNLFLMPVITHLVRQNEHNTVPGFLFLWFPTQLPVFLLGFAVYHWLHDARIMGSMARPGRAFSLMAAAAAVYVWLGLTVTNDRPLVPMLISCVIFAMVIVALAARPFPVLVNRLTCGIGRISYSCYLTHFAAIIALRHFSKSGLFEFLPRQWALPADYAVCWLIVFAITMAFSLVTYFLIEKPGIRLGNAIIRRLESSGAGAGETGGQAAHARDVLTGGQAGR